MNWAPGDPTVDWVFEWHTNHPSNMSLDFIEFPYGVDDNGDVVYSIDAGRDDVEYIVSGHSAPCNRSFSVTGHSAPY